VVDRLAVTSLVVAPFGVSRVTFNDSRYSRPSIARHGQRSGPGMPGPYTAADTRVRPSCAMGPPTYWPRAPVPMMPNETVELASAPKTVSGGKSMIPVAAVTASRLVIVGIHSPRGAWYHGRIEVCLISSYRW
jgi:hypothetical protein